MITDADIEELKQAADILTLKPHLTFTDIAQVRAKINSVISHSQELMQEKPYATAKIKE